VFETYLNNYNFIKQSALKKYKMNFLTKFDKIHGDAKQNRWLGYFAVFNRVMLALGFLPSGFVKIMGERFTDLSANHPMGNYLEALHHTGYYYTFIGVLQVTAAILLLIPRTALIGALLYFPIILNICILSFAVRFDGSLLSSPLMVLANFFLLCWDFDRLKYIFLPKSKKELEVPVTKEARNKFPFLFFSCSALTVFAIAFVIMTMFDIKPYNTIKDCNQQCDDSKDPVACAKFCDCIHEKGKPLNKCLDEYNQVLKRKRLTR
jgi:uncharacterized membrane protein YphA (DoxX/SURF4 family)